MIFVDTSAFLALLNHADQYHASAQRIWEQMLQPNAPRLVCNNYTLLETIALLQKRQGLGILRIFQDEIIPLLRVEWLTERDHTEAMGILLAANRRRLSLVDCSAFVTMRRLGIRQVFTFDPHFAEQGFELAGGGGEIGG